MRRILILISFLLLLCIAAIALFWQADFGVAQSNTNTDSSTSSGHPSGGLETIPRDLVLYVSGPASLAQPVSDQLVDTFSSSPKFDTVTVLDQPTQQADTSLLLVEVDPLGGFWTPFYAEAELVAIHQFATNGDVSGITPPRLLGTDDVSPLRLGASRIVATEPNLAITGGVVLEDTTLGLLSHPYYQRNISTAIVVHISASIHTSIDDARAE